jgi:DNA-binding transcriptional regulator YdaS (Cro superfamily)
VKKPRSPRAKARPRKRTVTTTPAQRALAAWLEREGTGAYTRTAEVLGVTPPAIHQWATGATIPDVIYRIALASLTRGAVRFEAWLTAAQNARLAEIMERVNERKTNNG